VGHPTQVTIDALGDAVYSGKISRIFPNLDPVTRRGTVEVELNPVPAGARPGQLCRVTLTTDAAQRLVVPFSALRRDQSGAYVYRVDASNIVHRSPVVSGLRINEQVEILKGLEAGQYVVTKGFLDLAVGKKVKMVASNGNGDETSTDNHADVMAPDDGATSVTIVPPNPS
jgi:membrane fusion protein (multidrug efflux system)